MRIEKNTSSWVSNLTVDGKTDRKTKGAAGADFKEQLAEINRQEMKERLDKLLVLIDEQGRKMKQSLDKKDLLEYKKRVKEFLKIIQEEFARAKQSFSWDSKGNLKTYTIIEKVDENLNILHKLFMEEQADVLEVLKRIDEIRGLLLDLYI